MIALFDSGNSRLHFSWWDGRKIKDPVSTPYPKTNDALTEIINNFFRGKKPQKVAACSVSSQWRELLFKALDRNAPGRLVVMRNACDAGISIAYDKPETIGVDRVLAAYAAHRFFSDSCVAVDVGTAVTVDAVAKDGKLMGGYIFPGLDLLSRSFSVKTSLPHVSAATVCEGIGKSTETCISKGIPIGFSGAVSELVKHAAMIAGDTDRIVVTGGDAEKLLQCLPFTAVHKPYLVLEGLGYSINKLPKYK